MPAKRRPRGDEEEAPPTRRRRGQRQTLHELLASVGGPSLWWDRTPEEHAALQQQYRDAADELAAAEVAPAAPLAPLTAAERLREARGEAVEMPPFAALADTYRHFPTMRDDRTAEQRIESYTRQMLTRPGEFYTNFETQKDNLVKGAKPYLMYKFDIEHGWDKLPDVLFRKAKKGYNRSVAQLRDAIKLWMSGAAGYTPQSVRIFNDGAYLVRPVILSEDMETIRGVLDEHVHTWKYPAGRLLIIGVDPREFSVLERFWDAFIRTGIAEEYMFEGRTNAAVIGKEKHSQRIYDPYRAIAYGEI